MLIEKFLLDSSNNELTIINKSNAPYSNALLQTTDTLDPLEIANMFTTVLTHEPSSGPCMFRTLPERPQPSSSAKSSTNLMFHARRAEPSSAHWRREVHPYIECFEDDNIYTIEADVPGFAKHQVTAEYLNTRTIKLSGNTSVGTSEPFRRPSESQEALPLQPAGNKHGRSLSVSVEDVKDEDDEEDDEVESGFVAVDRRTESRSSRLGGAPVEQAIGEVLPEPSSHTKAPAKAVNKRPVKKFAQEIVMPKDIDSEKTTAELVNGVLIVKVARLKPEALRRKIVVK